MKREEKTAVTMSKKLSWLLRHGAREAGVEMDSAGWVLVSDALHALRMPRNAFDDAVANNTKARFELDESGTRVRATQGHSLAGAPVDLDALEASWERYTPTESVWHGTNEGAVASIQRDGILPQARTHVHLAVSTTSPVGKRAAVTVLLEVSPARLAEHGVSLFRSPNGVVLARHVPASCIVGVVRVRSGR